ncbi:UDP-N-acetylmuramoyl-L-alanyl-D-glutamate--2,6-diaminopimelate ligase [Metabacillus sp. KIGAM252]|uniref:UDP-N-acetylmuramyl-tripeptide synthetase n=1 Tax=Metabacillus flavus TaxID=2823519 RepID=A0ABS5LFS8_9BACI|nr:UDP-N-acetylmuramoyl-L-alanyl-D-glutamate--2,6-diaminopimelate ligase [Metabacillus flavus]MBS2969598.1 UDP-N-acetylmuramoyl-L-alanyl-D-glutamate--2,6-diaminopimelate ligase [Metabacillus flavus]
MLIEFNQLKEMPIKHLLGPPAQEILHLAYDSRLVKDFSVFFSMKGQNHDGHQYIEDALSRGAVAVFGSSLPILQDLSVKHPDCTFMLVDNVRETMAKFAKVYYNSADEKIKTVGITGTNGKTTVAAYVRSLLTLLGMPSGSIGTTGIWSSKEKLSYKKSTPTTPESIDLQSMFHDLVSLGDEAVAMEVSSIALDQHRVDHIIFDVAIHTNLSEEHLEYHQTFEHYMECKMRLFKQAKHAVINLDDEGMGERLASTFAGPQITYSLSSNKQADLRAFNIDFSETGSKFSLLYAGSHFSIEVPVYGEYNISNVLSAVGAALLFGFKIEDIIKALRYLESPEGRFQIIKGPDSQKIILDYAHTPVALTRLLEEVKKLPHNRLIVMIAGIGIRDFAKMPKMAQVIENKADEIVVTVDHPGDHDPRVIVDQVMSGFCIPGAAEIHPTLTREQGVLKALSLGHSNDIILLTSGCINGAQMVKGKAIPHSDENIIETYYKSLKRVTGKPRVPAKKILLTRAELLPLAGRKNG